MNVPVSVPGGGVWRCSPLSRAAFIVVTISALALCSISAAQTADPTRKIVLIAGPITGHPKATHEYEKSVILLKHLLDTSPNVRGIRTEAHFRGWPHDPSTLDDADTIVLISDGGDRRESDHPLYVGDRLAVIERQMRRGCGLVNLHWTTFHPSRMHEKVTEWLGGYFDYETGDGPRRWHSAIESGDWTLIIPPGDHPIQRGVEQFNLRDEIYYKLRFRDRDPRLRPLLSIGFDTDSTIAWAVTRQDGGRGFGFTGGHFYANWWVEDFRRLVLNAIVWTAGVEVPVGGVESAPAAEVSVLIVTGYNHPAHDWRAVTAALLAVVEQDPRVRVDVTERVEDLARAEIERYDVLVLNYSNWDRPGLSEEAKENFVRYLREGGGLSVIHFANGAFNRTLPRSDSDWEEYRTRIVRRAWMHGEGQSGHDPYGPFRVDIASAEHAITTGLEPFETTDELYFRQVGDLAIEPLASARSTLTGRAEPMAWAYDYGRGRVFQTVLGHAAESVRRAGALIRRGTVWAARRSGISFDPPVELTSGVLFREGSAWTPERSRESADPLSPWTSSAGGVDARDVLPANPGLDSGLGGHWGLAREGEWDEERWNEMDTGPFFSASIATPGGTVSKAIAIRLGEAGQGGVCFDARQLSVRAGWTGGFLRLGTRFYGLIENPRIAGEVRFGISRGPGWDTAGRYRGLHVSAGRVVLEYDVGGTRVLESPWIATAGSVTAFTRTFELGPATSARRFRVAEVKGAHGTVSLLGGVPLARLEERERVTAVSFVGFAGGELEITAPATISLRLGAHAGSLSGKLFIWSGAPSELPDFARLVRASTPPEDLPALVRSRTPRWPETIQTTGHVSQRDAPYVIDTITVPFDNPYKALMFLSGHDFLGPHSAAVSSVHGDVWLVHGIDDRLERITWKRFAAGLYQPLGVKVVDDRIYVVGRDQITRLHDLNDDGEADFYENFFNDWTTPSQPHRFRACLETDREGNFYSVSPEGAHRVAADGSRHEVLASGWRNPNGLSVGPDGTITVAPQEGEWTPASQISEVELGAYYGYPGPRTTSERPLGYDAPLCWIPRHVDNSSGAQVWVTSDRWGPLRGQLLNLSFGRSAMQLVLRERVGDTPQGGVVPLAGRFRSGILRGRFHSRDGQLYVTGMKGWVTNAVEDGTFQRVRYTGGRVYLPAALHVHANGLRLVFTEPLLGEVAEDPASYSIEQWNYRYSKTYGSEEYSVLYPDEVGHDPVAVRSATVLEDGRSVFLEIDALRPVMQMHVRASLEAADGGDLSLDIYNTINSLGDRYELERVAPPPVREPPAARGAPGLILTLRSGRSPGTSDARVARLAALSVPAGTPPSPFLEAGPFEAVWEGSLAVESRSRVTFSAAGRGRVRLTVDGAVLLEGEGEDLSQLATREAVLKKGERPLSLEYSAPGRGDAWVRLYWSGREFARETVPPTVLRHDPDHAALATGRYLRRGRDLVARYRCLRCHELEQGDGEGAEAAMMMPEVSADAPSFVGIGSRLRFEWMARWMMDPRSLRPTATMPDLLAHAGARAAARDRDAWDIARFLETLEDERRPAPGATAPEEAGDAVTGGALFGALGCIGCHTLPDEPRLDARGGRVPLKDTGWKWQPGALGEYLMEPGRHYRFTSMPDFKLAPSEARDLARFLGETALSPPEFGARPPGDAAAGRRLVASLGCLNCHELPLENHFGARPPPPLAAADWDRAGGCVAPGPHSGPGPDFGLTEADKKALRDFARAALDSLSRRQLAEYAERSVERLRCGACHDRDGTPSRWSVLERETRHLESTQASGIKLQTRPALTFAGEQLHVGWLERFISGDLDDTPRPWLEARMPAFRARADLLAKGLALAHGQPPGAAAEAAAAPELALLGKRLVKREGGFACTTCHPVGAVEADMELHFGAVNLRHSRERLRPEYYLRWMLNPQRITPLSPMPAYTDEAGLTGLPDVLDGDGAKQFRAIWQYLGTLR